MDGKIKIIIASILKPLDDTRAFEKIGRSLAQTNKYEVNIIGFESKKTPVEKNISFTPIFRANRKHFLRLVSPFKCFRIFIKVKPKLIIVNTPELLLVSYLYKILFGTKIIYDVIENYQLNLAFDTTYKNWQKPILKLYLKIVEGLSPYFVNYYFLAEKIYAKQLKFIVNEPYTCIENKTAIKPSKEIDTKITFNSSQTIKCIITGTLGKSYGTLEGIAFFRRLKKAIPSASLRIIGYAADQEYKHQLINTCKNDLDIVLDLDNGPVAHQMIIRAIKEADLALMPYQLNDNLRQRIPTKIYEHIALSTPMLIPENEIWNKILKKHNAGLAIDFQQESIEDLSTKLITTTFYNRKDLIDISWKSEEIKLLRIFNSLI